MQYRSPMIQRYRTTEMKIIGDFFEPSGSIYYAKLLSDSTKLVLRLELDGAKRGDGHGGGIEIRVAVLQFSKEVLGRGISALGIVDDTQEGSIFRLLNDGNQARILIGQVTTDVYIRIAVCVNQDTIAQLRTLAIEIGHS